MAELFKGQVGSPITNLISSMTASQTTATVADANALPDAPNICTIGFGDNLETIRYGTKTGGSLGEITRGIEGAPRAWPVGSEVARFFTAYDHNNIVAHLEEKASIDSAIMTNLTATGLLNGAIAKKSDGNGVGLFNIDDRMIILYAVDKGTPSHYLFAMGYKLFDQPPMLTLISSNGLSLGDSNIVGTQTIIGGGAEYVTTYGITI